MRPYIIVTVIAAALNFPCLADSISGDPGVQVREFSFFDSPCLVPCPEPPPPKPLSLPLTLPSNFPAKSLYDVVFSLPTKSSDTEGPCFSIDPAENFFVCSFSIQPTTRRLNVFNLFLFLTYIPGNQSAPCAVDCHVYPDGRATVLGFLWRYPKNVQQGTKIFHFLDLTNWDPSTTFELSVYAADAPEPSPIFLLLGGILVIISLDRMSRKVFRRNHQRFK